MDEQDVRQRRELRGVYRQLGAELERLRFDAVLLFETVPRSSCQLCLHSIAAQRAETIWLRTTAHWKTKSIG